MEINHIVGALEAIFYASGEPIELKRLAEVFKLDEDVLLKLIKTMQDKYKSEESGIELLQLNDSFQFATKKCYAEEIKAALELKRNTPLSNAAMEILAIIAYNQPVTKAFIEQIRGVDSGQAVNSLAQKELVEEAGRLDLPGRPIAYRTTANFLRCFGLKSLASLPPLPDDSGQLLIQEIVEDKS